MGGPLRVLVVDDHKDNTEATALLLRMYGHEVKTAFSGEEAAQAALQDPPDVVLLDIGLPGCDGWKVARRLREMLPGRKLLLVAVSGHGREEDRKNSQEAGIDLHLLKPIDPDHLLDLLLRFSRTIVGDV